MFKPLFIHQYEPIGNSATNTKIKHSRNSYGKTNQNPQTTDNTEYLMGV